MKNYKLLEKIEKLEKVNNEQKLSLVYQWVKTDVINLKEFTELLNFYKKES